MAAFPRMGSRSLSRTEERLRFPKEGFDTVLAKSGGLGNTRDIKNLPWYNAGLSFGLFHENSRRKKLKLKSLKPKTQEFSPEKHKILSNFYNIDAQIFKRSKFLDIFNPSCQYFPKSCPKTQEFSQNSREISKKLNIPANPLTCDCRKNVQTTSLL